MNVERNIRIEGNRFKVMLTRRPSNIYVGRFDTLELARSARDEAEERNSARRPWGVRIKLVEKRRTVQQLYKERRSSGLCIYCAKPNDRMPLVGCSGCAAFNRMKRAARLSPQDEPKQLTAP